MRRPILVGIAVLIGWFQTGIVPHAGTVRLPTPVAADQPLTTEQPPLLISTSDWLNQSAPDLWWWNGENAKVFEGCTGDVMESEMLLSPNRRLVTYLSTSELWVEKLNQGWEGSGANFPNDVVLCNLDTGEMTRIASQPENATAEDGQWYFASRSLPTWSPDGNQLAWSEYTVGSNTLQLVVYDVTIGETKVLVENLNPENIYDLVMILRVSWSEAGIGVENFTGFEVYSDTGELLNTLTLPQDGRLKFWITFHDKLYVSYHDATGVWHLADPLNGEDQLMPGLPEMYSVAAPDGLALRYDVHLDPPPNDITPPFPQPRWSVMDGETVTPLDYDEETFNNRIAISPDGQRITYVYEDHLWEWQAGESSIAAGMEDFSLDSRYVSLVWVPLVWRVGAPSE